MTPELNTEIQLVINSLSRCLLPVQMGMAQEELAGEPLPDNSVVLHFMGSGASDQVTAGEVRKALNAAAVLMKKLMS